MSFAELIDAATLQGPPARLDLGAATRLGRAFGTALRRRTGGGSQIVVVARGGDGGELSLRDGLVRGLLLAGHSVFDVGVADEDAFTAALTSLGAAGGVRASSADERRRSLAFWLGKRPLAGDALTELATLADGEDFAAGEGTLTVVALPRSARGGAEGSA